MSTTNSTTPQSLTKNEIAGTAVSKSGGLDLAFNIAEKAVPKPYNVAVKAAKIVKGVLFPKPNMTLETLKEIQAQLDEMDKKLDEIQMISSATYMAVKTLAYDYAQNHYDSIVTALIDANIGINSKFEEFYTQHVFPRTPDEFYEFTANLCPGGVCSQTDSNILRLLGANVPELATKGVLTESQVTSSNLDPAELLNEFSDRLRPDRNIWKDLNKAYHDVLKKTHGESSIDNKVVYYMAAMQPIVTLQLNLLSDMQQLFFMNQVQVALLYNHPELYTGKHAPFPYALSDKSGKAGYEETLVYMADFFEDLGSKFIAVFGATEDSEDRTKGIIQFVEQADYLNNFCSGDNESDRLFNTENINNNCWIEELNMPNKKSEWHTGTVTALCQVSDDSQELTLKRLYFNFPYKVDNLNGITELNNPAIEYKDGVLKAKNPIDFKNIVDTSVPSGTPSASTWVAHTSGALGRYHLMYQKYKIKLDSSSEFTEHVYDDRKSKMNNSSRPNKYDMSVKDGKLEYPKWEGPVYSSSANPDGWTSSAYAETQNGRGYWVNSYFVQRDYPSSTGISDAKGQLIYLAPLKNDTRCEQTIKDGIVTLSWPAGNDQEATTVSIDTTTSCKCPDNSGTSGGGASFKCGENVLSVTTEAPIVEIQPLAPK